MRLTRLNHDSAWLVELDGTRIIVDPWLEGPAIVGVPWVHTAEIGHPAVAIEDLPPADGVLLSHPYPDHTNRATLRRLPRDLTIYSGRIACGFARFHGGPPRTHALADRTFGGAATTVGRVAISFFRGGLFDPTHNVYVLEGLDSGETLFYGVHAMQLGTRQAAAVEAVLGGRPLDALVCSFTHLDLPFWLGGVANLGEAAALGLVDRFRPRWVFQTHDAEKPDSGLIAKVTKITRCPDVAKALADREAAAVLVETGVGVAWSSDPARKADGPTRPLPAAADG